MASRPKLMLAKSTYREAMRPDGTPGFAMGRGRGRGNVEATLCTSGGLGWEHIGPKSATPPSAGQFEPANEPVDDEDSEEEILLLKPRGASSGGLNPLNVPAAGIPAPKNDPAEQPQESTLPEKKAEIRSMFASPKPCKKKLTLRLSNSDEDASTKAAAAAPAKPSVPPAGAWQKKAWQVPVPVPDQPQPAATVPTAAPKLLAKTPEEAPASAAEATHFFKLLTRASGGSEPPGLPGSSSSKSAPVAGDSAKSTIATGTAKDPVSQLAPQDGEACLPVDAARGDILAALAAHSVVVFKGDTGCGKSSRVPRFIVEADPEAKVVVAQPRRLAAIALARRVAHERTEVVGGAKGLVGYRVGHASKAGPKVRLTFATVGWLLQKLVHFVADGHATDGGSSGAQGSQFDYTVVIVDEVHERDLEMDLLLLVLRLILKKHSDAVREGAVSMNVRPPFKLVCMSATFDANEFVRYFRPATLLGHHPGAGAGGGVASPLVVGGRRFPVNATYLDDLLAQDFPDGHSPAPASAKNGIAHPPRRKLAATPRPPLWLPSHEAEAARRFLAARPFRKCIASSSGSNSKSALQAEEGGKDEECGEDDDEEAAVPDAVVRLAARLVLEVCWRRPGEGVLVFLSGLTEIEAVHEHLRDVAIELTASSGGSQTDRVSSVPNHKDGALAALGVSVSVLHSMVDLGDQAATLDQANKQSSAASGVEAPGASNLPLTKKKADNQSRPTIMTQVVLATNLAESSLTMPSLRTVIDLGLHKELVQLKASSSTPSSPRSSSSSSNGSSSSHRNATTLRKAWVSKASAQQRAGRAGRVAPGSVIRLYPRAFFEQPPDAGGMALFDAPEMARLPLDRVVLRAKLLGVKSVHATLMGALVPPPRSQVDAALQQLVELGAVVRVPEAAREGGCAQAPSAHDDGCAVTAMGRALGSLPLEFKASRLLLLGAPLGCGAEALVLACLLSAPPHSNLFEPLPQVDKMSSSGDAAGPGSGALQRQGGRLAACLRTRRIFDRGLYSDHLASLEAFKQWLLFRHALKHNSAAAATILVSSGAVSGEVAVSAGGSADNADLTATAAADALVCTPVRAETAWCRAWGLLKQRLVELELRCAEVAVRATALLPAAAHQFAVLLKDTSSSSAQQSEATVVAGGGAVSGASEARQAPLGVVPAAPSSVGETPDDFLSVVAESSLPSSSKPSPRARFNTAADTRISHLRALGQDVPTLQMLLLYAALPGGGSSLIRADRKLAPPRLLARFPHLDEEGSSSSSSVFEKTAAAAAPLGARMALLAGVTFQPLASGPTTIAAAASLLRAALEAWCGPMNRLEFVPPEGHDPTMPRALAGAQLLAAGRWIVEFPATPLEENGSAGIGNSSDGGNVDGNGSLNAMAVTAVEGHSGGLRDLALCDFPLGLKALAHLSLAPRGLRLPVPPTATSTRTPPSSTQAPHTKGKSGKSRKGQGKDGGKSSGSTGTNSGNSKNSSSDNEASVFVSSVRWSFSTQWHLPILATAAARNSSSSSSAHVVPYVVPSRGSSLCFTVNTSRSGHKNPGYAICGDLRKSSSVPGAVPTASACTALPHDSAALAAALLLLAPPTATLVLSPAPSPPPSSSNGADKGASSPPPQSAPSFQGGRLGYLVPRRSHSGYKLREVHHWKGALTLRDLEMVNAVRSRLSEALGPGPLAQSSSSPSLSSSSAANSPSSGKEAEGETQSCTSTDLASRPLDGRHDPSLTFAFHAALRHLASKLKAPTGSSGGNGSSKGSSSSAYPPGTPTTFMAFESHRNRGACLPEWRCLDLHHRASLAATFPGYYSTAHVSEDAMQAAAGLGHETSTTAGQPGMSDQSFFLSGAEIEAGALATAISPSKMRHNMQGGDDDDDGSGEAVGDANDEEEEVDENWEDDYGDEFMGDGEGGFADSAQVQQPPPGLGKYSGSSSGGGVKIPPGLEGIASGTGSASSSAVNPSTRKPKGEFDLMRALGLNPATHEATNGDDDNENDDEKEPLQEPKATGEDPSQGIGKKSAAPSTGEEQLMRDLGLLPSPAPSAAPSAPAAPAAASGAAFTSAPAASGAFTPLPVTRAPAASASSQGVNSAALAMLFDSNVSPPAQAPAEGPVSSAPSTNVSLATLFGAPPPPSPPTMAAAGNYTGAMFDLSDLEGGEDEANVVYLADLEGGVSEEDSSERIPKVSGVPAEQKRETVSLGANPAWNAALFG